MRVGFVPSYGDWMGGRNYFKNLFLALNKASESCDRTGYLLWNRARSARIRSDFPAVMVIETGILNRLSPAWTLAGMAAKLGFENPLTSRLLEKHDVVALSHELLHGH